VIDWLLKPDLRQLALAKYDSLKLKFVENDTNYELIAKTSSEKVTLSIRGPRKPLVPITVDLVAFAGDELVPEPHEIPMWELLKSFSRPTFISLDRTVSAESEEGYYLEAQPTSSKRQRPSRSPTGRVQEVTSSRYAEFRTKAIANDNELKANIVMSALQDPEMAFRGGAIKPMTEKQIRDLEEKVTTYLSATIKSADVHTHVQRFFSASRKFSEQQYHAEGQRALIFDFVATQYRQIESLAKAFNDFEKKNALAFKSLSGYLLAVNQFFNDSNKELFFDESTGKLAFSSTSTKDAKRFPQQVTCLSSGERQILVLFTFLAFVSDPKGVFIVDEPELSLHPKWQAEFMDAFLRLRPEGTQLLLATHSPDIVGKYKSNCVALRGIKS
jgi:predicted ATPase